MSSIQSFPAEITLDSVIRPGQPLGFSVAAGAEIVCTGGLLYVTATSPWLGQAWAPVRRPLPAGQAWRASEAQWIKLEVCQQPARYRLTHAAVCLGA